MTKVFPKCLHVRNSEETVPEWQCPNCLIAYQKFGIAKPVTSNAKISKTFRIYWPHVLVGAIFSPIFAAALWKMHFIDHPVLTGLGVFFLVCVIPQTNTGGRSNDHDSFTSTGNSGNGGLDSCGSGDAGSSD
jgi:hypothetical protein